MCSITKLSNKILSIQSHVISGYVGNKCCVLPLQILGNEVDFINTVQYSNHTGYRAIKGQVIQASDISDLYSGLTMNNLTNYKFVITGYIGSNSQLDEVYKIVEDVKKNNANVMFYCDPVLGDNGKMYVPENLMQIYRDKIIPISDVVFPNQFEAELLTNCEIKKEADVFSAISVFHKIGVKVVVITSTDLGPANLLYGYVSERKTDGSQNIWRLEIPKLSHVFVGTGDLFAALFLAWMIKEPNNMAIVCTKVIGSMQLVLNNTITKYEALKSEKCSNKSYMIELNLIDSIEGIMKKPSCHNSCVVKLKL